MLTLFFCVLVAALIFEFINGFHDTALAIATVVSTKVMTPRNAILLAACTNLLGALAGTAVAHVVGKEFVDASAITMPTVLAALLGGILWNLFTWWLGLPSSSSHALVGSLCGAAIATSPRKWDVLLWHSGLWPKLVKPTLISPLIGFVFGYIVMASLNWFFRKSAPSKVNRLFAYLQTGSAALMGYSHGGNDAQKTMAIVALALFTGTQNGAFAHLPEWMGFLRLEKFEIPQWVTIMCALTMFAGTAVGGWRIIATIGRKMVKLMPVNGFAAETTAAVIIQTASLFGIPLSTTYVISTSIMGVGATRRFSAVKWGIVGRIAWAWVLTLPVTGLLGFCLMRLLNLLGAR